tara:strand:- start:4894 stop:5547 length:654 start_codon:yes stop_codon:yes gene_type:complete
MEKVVDLLIGLPCSGKSTYRDAEYNHQDTFVISMDDIRERYCEKTGVSYLDLFLKPKEGDKEHPLFGKVTKNGNWELIEAINKNMHKDFERSIRMSLTALNEGKRVVVDMKNITKKERKTVLKWFKDEGEVHFRGIIFEYKENFDLIKSQNKIRGKETGKVIPDFVLDKLKEDYTPVDLGEGITEILFVDGLKGLKKEYKSELKSEKKINRSKLRMK